MLRISSLNSPVREEIELRIALYQECIANGQPIDYIPYEVPSAATVGVPDCYVNRIAAKYPQAGIAPMTAREMSGIASDIVRAFSGGKVSEWKVSE